MQILSASGVIVNQLISLCEKISSDQYSTSMDLLMNNSIGKHVRHIVEFYDILKESSRGDGILCYDFRDHCSKTETDIKIAIDRLRGINKWFGEIITILPLS